MSSRPALAFVGENSPARSEASLHVVPNPQRPSYTRIDLARFSLIFADSFGWNSLEASSPHPRMSAPDAYLFMMGGDQFCDYATALQVRDMTVDVCIEHSRIKRAPTVAEIVERVETRERIYDSFFTPAENRASSERLSFGLPPTECSYEQPSIWGALPVVVFTIAAIIGVAWALHVQAQHIAHFCLRP